MDTAVGLVEAYLYANGYFTVTEHPIIEELGDGGYRTVTDDGESSVMVLDL